MNDNDDFETVARVSALDARPPLVRADTASFARGWRPTPRDEALRALSLVEGAAQLAPR